MGIPAKQKVYPVDLEMIFPVAGRGRPRKRHIPDQLSLAAETVLASQPWRSVTWRRGTKGRLSARFAALRVRVADGRVHATTSRIEPLVDADPTPAVPAPEETDA